MNKWQILQEGGQPILLSGNEDEPKTTVTAFAIRRIAGLKQSQSSKQQALPEKLLSKEKSYVGIPSRLSSDIRHVQEDAGLEKAQRPSERPSPQAPAVAVPSSDNNPTPPPGTTQTFSTPSLSRAARRVSRVRGWLCTVPEGSVFSAQTLGPLLVPAPQTAKRIPIFHRKRPSRLRGKGEEAALRGGWGRLGRLLLFESSEGLTSSRKRALCLRCRKYVQMASLSFLESTARKRPPDSPEPN